MQKSFGASMEDLHSMHEPGHTAWKGGVLPGTNIEAPPSKEPEPSAPTPMHPVTVDEGWTGRKMEQLPGVHPYTSKGGGSSHTEFTQEGSIIEPGEVKEVERSQADILSGVPGAIGTENARMGGYPTGRPGSGEAALKSQLSKAELTPKSRFKPETGTAAYGTEVAPKTPEGQFGGLYSDWNDNQGGALSERKEASVLHPAAEMVPLERSFEPRGTAATKPEVQDFAVAHGDIPGVITKNMAESLVKKRKPTEKEPQYTPGATKTK